MNGSKHIFEPMIIEKLFDYSIKSVPKGGVLFNEGDENKFVYFIKEGKVKVTKKKIVIGFTQTAEFVGITSCLCDGLIYYFSALAVEDSDLYVINKNEFKTIIQKNDIFGKKIIDLLCERISLTELKTNSFINDSPHKRILRELILNTSTLNNKKVVKLSINDIAELTGTSFSACTKYIRKLKKEKYIDVPYGSQTIEILDPEFLEVLLNEE